MSIFVLTVSIWRPRRKILAPTFSPKNLTHFVDIFSKQSSYMVKYLGKAAKTGNFSIWKYINTYSMDSICGKISNNYYYFIFSDSPTGSECSL